MSSSKLCKMCFLLIARRNNSFIATPNNLKYNNVRCGKITYPIMFSVLKNKQLLLNYTLLLLILLKNWLIVQQHSN